MDFYYFLPGKLSCRDLLIEVIKLEICPERQVNEMHALYDKHHKVSSFLESH